MIDYISIYFKKKTRIFSIIFTLLLIIFIYLRLFNLTEVYTPYDDIAPIAAHKGILGDQEININNYFLNQNYILSEKFIHNIENSLLYPLYIIKTTTYPIGRYFFYPFFLDDNDNYNDKIFKNRIVSSIFSILSIFLLTLLLKKIDYKDNFLILFIVSIFGFSTSEILLAHHGSPYSSYTFFSLFGILLLYLLYDKKIFFLNALIYNSILIYFSYFNILFYLPILFISLDELKNVKKDCIKFFYQYKFKILSIFLLALPLLIILYSKINSSINNNIIFLDLLDISKTNNLIYDFFFRLLEVYLYFFDGLFINSILNFNIFFSIIIILSIYKIINYFKNNNNYNIFLISLIIILCQWIILYFFNILPLFPTRHINFLFPIILIFIFIVVKSYKLFGNLFFIFFLIFFPYLISENLNNIKKLQNQIDYNYINSFNVEKIFTFGGTLDPILYYDKIKNVYNLDYNSLNNNLKLLSNDKEIILISHNESFNKWFNGTMIKKNIKKELSNYDVFVKKEIKSQESFSKIDAYNNFYFYLLKRK